MFVFRIFANHADNTFSAYNTAVIAHFFNGWTDFHKKKDSKIVFKKNRLVGSAIFCGRRSDLVKGRKE